MLTPCVINAHIQEVPVLASPLVTRGLLALAALALGGCNGAFWGNLVVLAVSVGIFVGTLVLGRASRNAAGASASSSGRS